MEEILKLKKVNYRYNDAEKDDYVLKDINLKFEMGKTYAIKGKSGSGKTTLLSLISGLETNYEGSILYENKELKKIDLDRYRNSDIGIVFQSYNLLTHLTARENIVLSMDLNRIKLSKKEKIEKTNELLKSVGLTKKDGDKRILRLSGGQQQRVAIARSLSYNPKILIADEPTGNLDKETEKEILKIFTSLAHDENKCVIIVTHSENVCALCDEVFELKQK